MPSAPCRFFKRGSEFRPRKEAELIPDNTRGIYSLLKKTRRGTYDVVYIGCSAGKVAGIYARLQSHLKSKLEWTHFSVFEAHDNISRDEIREFEGLFLHIYSKDGKANRLNRQRSYKNLGEIIVRNLADWSHS